MKAEEIFELRAGDQHRDPVGKTDDDGTGNEFHRRSHAGHTQNNQQNSGHHGAKEEAIHSMDGNDASDDYDESPGWAADLGLRSSHR